ncbi:outer membrane beta-barrel protein [uncultured Aureimonas sp.]|uniref:outer membrane protein n=1 Tax=uncultured Aureimonas sp. TaxID=1604662 RepID=UPI0025E6589F|nr:outer membrane beta-barrel protein [uncultured Aureimonas sp.]
MFVARHLLAASLLTLASSAFAADIDILAAPEIAIPVAETGLYLRADATYGFDTTFGGTQFLVGPGGTATNRMSDWRLDDGFGVGGGVGYKANDWLRFDATLDYWKQDVSGGNGAGWFCGFDASCASRERGEIEAVEIIGNAYVDLGTVAGFTPYVGAGLGAVHVDYGDVAGAAFCTGAGVCPAGGSSAVYDGAASWRFAYAVSAGVSYDVTDSLSIDTGYRYLNVWDGDAYRFDTASGARLVAEDEGFDRHTIRAGLRFKLW